MTGGRARPAAERFSSASGRSSGAEGQEKKTACRKCFGRRLEVLKRRRQNVWRSRRKTRSRMGMGKADQARRDAAGAGPWPGMRLPSGCSQPGQQAITNQRPANSRVPASPKTRRCGGVWPPMGQSQFWGRLRIGVIALVSRLSLSLSRSLSCARGYAVAGQDATHGLSPFHRPVQLPLHPGPPVPACPQRSATHRRWRRRLLTPPTRGLAALCYALETATSAKSDELHNGQCRIS